MHYSTTFTLLVTAAAIGPAWAQQAADEHRRVAGAWMGALALDIPFRVVLTVRAGGGPLSGTMDFPDQNVRGLPLTEARMAGDSLHLRLAPAAVSFAGRLMAGDSIVGTFAQGAQRFPLTFRRPTPEQLGGLDRPQEPKPPYPYREEEVRIAADSGIVLAGTLTLPPGTGRHPAVLLFPGPASSIVTRRSPVIVPSSCWPTRSLGEDSLFCDTRNAACHPHRATSRPRRPPISPATPSSPCGTFGAGGMWTLSVSPSSGTARAPSWQQWLPDRIVALGAPCFSEPRDCEEIP
jgi:hypothetical protein